MNKLIPLLLAPLLAAIFPVHAADWPGIHADDFGISRAELPPQWVAEYDTNGVAATYIATIDAYLATWIERRTNLDGYAYSAVYGRLYDGLEGRPLGDEQQLSCTVGANSSAVTPSERRTSGDVNRTLGLAVAAMPHASQALLAWSGEDIDPASPMTAGKSEIFARKLAFTTGGLLEFGTMSDCVRVSVSGTDDSQSTYAADPDIAVYGSDNDDAEDDYYVISWSVEDGTEAGKQVVHARSFSAAAADPLGGHAEVALNQIARADQGIARIALRDSADPGSGVLKGLAAWRARNPYFGDAFHIYTSEFHLDTSSGALTAEPWDYVTNLQFDGSPMPGDHVSPDVGYSPEGGYFLVIWEEQDIALNGSRIFDTSSLSQSRRLLSKRAGELERITSPRIEWNPANPGWDMIAWGVEADGSAASTSPNVELLYARFADDAWISNEFDAFASNLDVHDDTTQAGINQYTLDAEISFLPSDRPALAMNTLRGRGLALGIAVFDVFNIDRTLDPGFTRAVIGQQLSALQVDTRVDMAALSPGSTWRDGDSIELTLTPGIVSIQPSDAVLPAAYLLLDSSEPASVAITSGCMTTDATFAGALFTCELPSDPADWTDVALQLSPDIDTRGPDLTLTVSTAVVIPGNFDPDESGEPADMMDSLDVSIQRKALGGGSGGGGAPSWLLSLLACFALRRRG